MLYNYLKYLFVSLFIKYIYILLFKKVLKIYFFFFFLKTFFILFFISFFYKIFLKMVSENISTVYLFLLKTWGIRHPREIFTVFLFLLLEILIRLLPR